MATEPIEALELMKHCVDYRTLRGKRDELGLVLSPGDGARLDELERFFSERPDRDAPEYARRDHVRRPVRLIVEYRAADGARAGGVVRDLSCEGVFLETLYPLAPGARTVLRVFDRAGGSEWRLGASVVWVKRSRGMGLRFVGIPLDVRLGHDPRKRPLRRAA
jgi:hypothetical protein